MSFESTPNKDTRPKSPLTLEALLSDSPVQGLGYEPFTPEQRVDLDALLNSFGTRLGDPILRHLNGDAVLDMIEYVRAKPGSAERTSSRSRIESAYVAATEEDLKHV